MTLLREALKVRGVREQLEVPTVRRDVVYHVGKRGSGTALVMRALAAGGAGKLSLPKPLPA